MVSLHKASQAPPRTVAFLTIDQQTADAIRFPGEFTQLAPRGDGQAIAQRWNAENLDALIEDQQQRWERGQTASGPGNNEPEPAAVESRCPRCGIGADQAGWCDFCGLDLRPDATHPRFSRDAQRREEAWNQSQAADVQQRFEEADIEWLQARDRAFRDGGESFTRLKWVTDNPRPTIESVYEAVNGVPYPVTRPRRAGHEDTGRPAKGLPAPTDGARVEPIDSAWHATLTGTGGEDFVRVVAGPGPTPREQVAELLSDLRSDGWSVLHWADERRVVHDQDSSRTETVGFELVLQRGAVTP